jgi:hypothetical protein
MWWKINAAQECSRAGARSDCENYLLPPDRASAQIKLLELLQHGAVHRHSDLYQ